MKNKLKKLALVLSFALFVAGCGNGDKVQEQPESAAADEGQEADGANAEDNGDSADDAEAVTLNLAYQYGLAYAPLVIVQ